MFCPQCSQERLSTETSFCSRCGYLLTGTADLLQTGGLIPRFESASEQPSPRSRGVKKGVFIFLLAFLVVPLFALITVSINLRSPVLPVLALLILGVGGLLRIAYALMFESPAPGAATAESAAMTAAQNLLNRQKTPQLPPEQSVPVSAYAPPVQGSWRNTNELDPHSVTENTTKLLEKEEIP